MNVYIKFYCLVGYLALMLYDSFGKAILINFSSSFERPLEQGLLLINFCLTDLVIYNLVIMIGNEDLNSFPLKIIESVS